jgi:hypothetical protein
MQDTGPMTACIEIGIASNDTMRSARAATGFLTGEPLPIFERSFQPLQKTSNCRRMTECPSQRRW